MRKLDLSIRFQLVTMHLATLGNVVNGLLQSSFPPVELPNNQLLTSVESSVIGSLLECGAKCGSNTAVVELCAAFQFKEEGPSPSCECGLAYWFDTNKGSDNSLIDVYVDPRCLRTLPPSEFKLLPAIKQTSYTRLSMSGFSWSHQFFPH